MKDYRTCCLLLQSDEILQHKFCWNREVLRTSICQISGNWLLLARSSLCGFSDKIRLSRSEAAGRDDAAIERPEREELGGLEIDDSLAWFCIEQSCRSVTADLDCWGHVRSSYPTPKLSELTFFHFQEHVFGGDSAELASASEELLNARGWWRGGSKDQWQQAREHEMGLQVPFLAVRFQFLYVNGLNLCKTQVRRANEERFRSGAMIPLCQVRDTDLQKITILMGSRLVLLQKKNKTSMQRMVLDSRRQHIQCCWARQIEPILTLCILAYCSTSSTSRMWVRAAKQPCRRIKERSLLCGRCTRP
jgi:hypothetical protein